MALISCPECNTQVSDRAETCVSCGTPIYDKSQDYNWFKMKKEGSKSILKIFIPLLIMTSLAIFVSNNGSIYTLGMSGLLRDIGYATLYIACFPVFHVKETDTPSVRKKAILTYIFLVFFVGFLDHIFLL